MHTTHQPLRSRLVAHLTLAPGFESPCPRKGMRPALLTPEELIKIETDSVHSMTHCHWRMYPVIFFRDKLLSDLFIALSVCYRGKALTQHVDPQCTTTMLHFCSNPGILCQTYNSFSICRARCSIVPIDLQAQGKRRMTLASTGRMSSLQRMPSLRANVSLRKSWSHGCPVLYSLIAAKANHLAQCLALSTRYWNLICARAASSCKSRPQFATTSAPPLPLRNIFWCFVIPVCARRWALCQMTLSCWSSSISLNPPLLSSNERPVSRDPARLYDDPRQWAIW